MQKKRETPTNTNSNINAVHLTRVYRSDMPLIDAKSFHTLIVDEDVNGNRAHASSTSTAKKGSEHFRVDALDVYK